MIFWSFFSASHPSACAVALPAEAKEVGSPHSHPTRVPLPHGLAEEFSLRLDIGPDLRPKLDKRCCGNACQFARLNLVQTATVNPAFAPKFVASDLTEQRMDGFGTVGMSAKHRREAVSRVEHQVEIGSNRLRAVPDEAERLLVVRAAAHVCAEERGGLSLFLLVPRAALADQITIHDAKRLSGPQVFPKRRVLGFDHRLG